MKLKLLISDSQDIADFTNVLSRNDTYLVVCAGPQQLQYQESTISNLNKDHVF